MVIIVLILMGLAIYFLGNGFGSLLTSGVRQGQSIALSQSFVKLGDLKKYSYKEIVAACGSPRTSQLITDTKGVACYRRTWWSPKYEVTIIFETDDKVRYVEKETCR